LRGLQVPTKVARDIDFKNRIPVELPLGMPKDVQEQFQTMFTQPTTTFHSVDNCVLCQTGNVGGV
jgi:hypothetical protein